MSKKLKKGPSLGAERENNELYKPKPQRVKEAKAEAAKKEKEAKKEEAKE